MDSTPSPGVTGHTPPRSGSPLTGTPLWSRFGSAGGLATGEGLGDLRDADQQHGGDLSHGKTRIERREHPFAQVLGLGPASFPKHANLRSSTTDL